MSRVLLVDLSWSFGGADVRVAQIATRLADRFDVAVAVIAGSQTHAMLARRGLDVLPLGRGRKDPRLAPDLMGLMGRLKPKVVDAHNPQSMLWGLPAARAAGVPIRLATFHSIFEESEKRTFGAPLYRGLNYLVSRSATHAVAVSDTVARYLATRSSPAGGVVTIRNGVEIPARMASRQRSARLRIVSVGRLVPVKGQDILITALSRMEAQQIPAECVFVGDGPERQRLEQLAERVGVSDRVRFLGFREDVGQIVSECDVFCLPSLTEALPFAVLEAAARAMPIVASRVGMLDRYFTDGDSAKLLPPGDVEALTAALNACARDFSTAAVMGERARQVVARELSVEGMIAATAALYDA
jgi:glycosyltransferase involved in cell wall biosynthesis